MEGGGGGARGGRVVERARVVRGRGKVERHAAAAAALGAQWKPHRALAWRQRDDARLPAEAIAPRGEHAQRSVQRVVQRDQRLGAAAEAAGL